MQRDVSLHQSSPRPRRQDEDLRKKQVWLIEGLYEITRQLQALSQERSSFFFTSGTFVEDSLRLIWEVRNGTLEDVIAIHEDLCKVVCDTVSAYGVWFVLHWFSFGAGMTVNIILISKEMMTDGDSNHTQGTTFKISLCLILVGVLYLFALPCFYAARITSKCNGEKFIL